MKSPALWYHWQPREEDGFLPLLSNKETCNFLSPLRWCWKRPKEVLELPSLPLSNETTSPYNMIGDNMGNSNNALLYLLANEVPVGTLFTSQYSHSNPTLRRIPLLGVNSNQVRNLEFYFNLTIIRWNLYNLIVVSHPSSYVEECQRKTANTENLFIFIFFNLNLLLILFCAGFRCTTQWLDNHILYKVSSPDISAPGWHHT